MNSEGGRAHVSISFRSKISKCGNLLLLHSRSYSTVHANVALVTICANLFDHRLRTGEVNLFVHRTQHGGSSTWTWSNCNKSTNAIKKTVYPKGLLGLLGRLNSSEIKKSQGCSIRHTWCEYILSVTAPNLPWRDERERERERGRERGSERVKIEGSKTILWIHIRYHSFRKNGV